MVRGTGNTQPFYNQEELQHMITYDRYNKPIGYYVYAYIRSKDSATAKVGTPYYIGKGINGRARAKHRVRIPKQDEHILIIKSDLDPYEANDLEIRLIRWYGRKDIGTGILLNQTNGGDGVPGRKNKPATIKKMKASAKIRMMRPESKEMIIKSNRSRKDSDETRYKKGNSMRGKSHSDKTRKKMSQIRKGVPNMSAMHPIMANYVIYRSIRESAHSLGCYSGTIRERIKRGIPGYKYL